MVFTISETKRATYLLIAAPAIFLMIADFFFFLKVYLSNQKQKWPYVMILILLIGLPVRYSFERLKLFSDKELNPQWSMELKELTGRLHFEEKENVVIFNINKPIEAMFYSGFTVYEGIPGTEKFQELKSQGYEVWVNDPENLFSDYGTNAKHLYGNY